LKSEIKIKLGSEWRALDYYPNARSVKFTQPKAVKFVVDSFKAQGIVPVVSYEADYALITAEAA
jgi:hypothetical protein